MKTVIGVAAAMMLVGCSAPAVAPTTPTTSTTPTPTATAPSFKTYEPYAITWEEWALDTVPTLLKVGKEMEKLNGNANKANVVGIVENLTATERLLKGIQTSPDDGETSDILHKAAFHYGKAAKLTMQFDLDEALVQMEKANALLNEALELIPVDVKP